METATRTVTRFCVAAAAALGINAASAWAQAYPTRPVRMVVASVAGGILDTVELMGRMAGIEIVHVLYKGSAAPLADPLAGNISMMFVDVLSSMPHVKSGHLKLIAVTGLQRSASVPDYPTLHESGLPGFNGSSWLGLVAPTGTPREIVARLSAVTAKILNSPEVRDRFIAQGVEPVGSTPEQLAAFIESEIPRCGEAARAAGIKPQ